MPKPDAGQAGGAGQDVAPTRPGLDNPFPAYLTLEAGQLPVVLSASQGGTVAMPGVPVRSGSGVTTVRDARTYELTRMVQTALVERHGASAHVVAAQVSREYIDFNRAPDANAYQHPDAAMVYEAYHAALRQAAQAARAQAASCALVLDVHGQSMHSALVYRGTRNGNTADRALLHGPDSILARLIELNIAISPTSPTATENIYFTGGHIVHDHGLRSTTAPVHAVQLEFGGNYRQPAALQNTADAVTDAIISHLQTHCPEITGG